MSTLANAARPVASSNWRQERRDRDARRMANRNKPYARARECTAELDPDALRAIEELVTDAESRPFDFDDRLGIIAADSVAADLKVDHSEATRAVRVTADC